MRGLGATESPEGYGSKALLVVVYGKRAKDQNGSKKHKKEHIQQNFWFKSVFNRQFFGDKQFQVKESPVK